MAGGAVKQRQGQRGTEGRQKIHPPGDLTERKNQQPQLADENVEREAGRVGHAEDVGRVLKERPVPLQNGWGQGDGVDVKTGQKERQADEGIEGQGQTVRHS